MLIQALGPYLLIIQSTFTVYIFIVLGLKVFVRKELGHLSLRDFVLLLLVCNALQNAMLAENMTLMGGLVSATTIMVTDFLLRKTVFRYIQRRRRATPDGHAVTLVYKGRIHEQNLRAMAISINELLGVIKKHGITDVATVDLLMLEPDGHYSLRTNDFTTHATSEAKNA